MKLTGTVTRCDVSRDNTEVIMTCILVIGQQQTQTRILYDVILFSPESQPYKVNGRNPVLAMVNSKSGENLVCILHDLVLLYHRVTLCNNV